MQPVYLTTEGGKLQVLVNEKTGRIYSFAPASSPIELTTDEQTRVVHVDADTLEFAEQVQRGLFYKSGGFYRSIQPQTTSLFAIQGQKVVIRCQLPEQEEAEAQVEVYDEQGNLLEQGRVISNNQGAIEYYFLASGLGKYKVVIQSEEYGRSSAYVYIQPQARPKAIENLNNGDVKGAIGQLPNLSQGLSQQVSGISTQAISKGLLKELESLPEPLKSKLKSKLSKLSDVVPKDLLDE